MKRFKELLLAVIKAKRVRMVMKKHEIQRLAKEIKDLSKLQRLNFNSKRGYAAKVYIDKKHQFVEMFNQ